MAQITLGIGMSHSPRLVTEPAGWRHFGSFAASMGGFIDIDGSWISSDDLVSKYEGQFAEQTTDAVWNRHHQTTQESLARLAQSVREKKIDALIVLGDDQHEMLTRANYPSILIGHGETFRMVDSDAKAVRRGLGPLPAFLREQIATGWYMDANHDYPNHLPLATRIIQRMIDNGMTPAVFDQPMPDNSYGIGHAIGIVIKRLLNHHAGAEARVPIVPILLNTYFPPNQPTPSICWRIGEAIKEAVEQLPDDLNVGIVASGGLSHFIVNETWDHHILQLMRTGDPEALTSIPMKMLQSGNSEVLNWIATASACRHLAVDWDAYAPVYSMGHREGVGLAFMEWR